MSDLEPKQIEFFEKLKELLKKYECFLFPNANEHLDFSFGDGLGTEAYSASGDTIALVEHNPI